MAIQQNLAEDFRAAVRTRETDRLFGHWSECLEKKKLQPQDFSIREMFRAAVEDGTAIVEDWTYNPADPINLRESGVNLANFSRINKQLIDTTVMEAYQEIAHLADQLVNVVPDRNLYGSRVPGVAQIGDQAQAVGEGKPFPDVGFGEDYRQVPDKAKRGMICPITKEAVFQDLTGLVLERGREVGRWMAENRELRILNIVMGNISTYNRKNRGVVPNYSNATATHDFDNLVESNPLVDWTSFDAVRMAFDLMVDPNTGVPINVSGNQTLVPSGLAWHAQRIIGATQIEHVDNQASAETIRTVSSNPASGLQSMSSPYVASVQGNQTTWYQGDFKRAFEYREAWGITVAKAPPNSEEEFTRDVVDRFKVSECGVAVAKDPRYVVKSTA